MRYNSLYHLIGKSASSRRFFMSLPQDVQCYLKKDSRFIGTQFELRRYAEIAMSLKRKQLVR